MKSMTYHYGNCTIKAHFKTVGQGWEVCVNWGKKTIFVGNFIHKAEAGKWWNLMNAEIRHFTKTYWVNTNATANGWYGKFISNHLYKCYYAFLDKMFAKYNKTFSHALTRDTKKYRTMRKNFGTHRRFTLVRAA